MIISLHFLGFSCIPLFQAKVGISSTTIGSILGEALGKISNEVVSSTNLMRPSQFFNK